MHQDPSIYEEEKLISLLATGSEYAFQLLYDRYRNRIYQTAIRYLKSPLPAQEVVQDVFLKLWFERAQIRSNQCLEAWLYTVARNNILNRLKKIAREWKAMDGLKQVLPPAADNTAHKVEDAQYNRLLQEAIRELPEQQQKVFQLARQEQLTYAEIGEQMGLSPLTVKTHMSRALAAIKAYLARHGELFFFCLYSGLSFALYS